MRPDEFQEAVRPRMRQDYAPGGPLAALDNPYVMKDESDATGEEEDE